MKKKILLLAFTILFNIVSVFSQGGTIGPLIWKIENDTLTISGEGEMFDYFMTPLEEGGYFVSAPWHTYCNLFNTVVIDYGVMNIGEFAFFDCKQFSVINIANSVTKIGSYVFTYSNPSSIILPNSVTFIDDGAFDGCGFSSVTLPDNLTNIGQGAFIACKNLTSVINHNPVPLSIDPLVFYETNISACNLYVPSSSVSLYKEAPVWKEFNILAFGIEDYEDEVGNEQLVIYPNPTTGSCKIILPQDFLHESGLSLSVYDISGKLLQQINIDNGLEETGIKLNLNAKGIYTALLSNGKKSYKGKIVFE